MESPPSQLQKVQEEDKKPTLKTMVHDNIMNEIIKSEKRKEPDWRILVVDELGTKMLSSCLKMHEIAWEGITLVEDICKKREPIPLEAIYLVCPTESTIDRIVEDFPRGRGMYKAAHVFFMYACPDELIRKLGRTRAARYIKTLKEINMAFVPYESHVFSLHHPEAFQHYFHPATSHATSRKTMQRMAEQLATLCVTLGEHPSIIYRRDHPKNVEFAQTLQEKLDAYNVDEPKIGEGLEKARSLLLILDRGFDAISPLLHELTYQAMAHDVCQLENNVYAYQAFTGFTSEVFMLEEQDTTWLDQRHEHIFAASKNIYDSIKTFSKSKTIATDQPTTKVLSRMAQKMPQYKEELNNLNFHLHLAEECMRVYKKYAGKLCLVEQDLAMGTDDEGERIREGLKRIRPILTARKLLIDDKIRIILLFILARNGIHEDDLGRLMKYGKIPESERSTILNLSHLGLNVVIDGNPKEIHQPIRKDRTSEDTYLACRWTPLIKDVMETAIEDKLDKDHYPFLARRQAPEKQSSEVTSARQRSNQKASGSAKRVHRLIVFIVGGVTFSEMRSAYEITKACEKWEVIIGSTQILTPTGFLKNLKEFENVDETPSHGSTSHQPSKC
ncbi:unnamed protein product, partial [Darwinula stevensoni]